MPKAQTWDSYKNTLIRIFEYFKPESVFEWGVGSSTDTILGFDFIKSLDSVEGSSVWFDKYKHKTNERFRLIYEPNSLLYPLVTGRFGEYDFIFVDGVKREKCLETAMNMLKENSIVMLHDANRPNYKSFIDMYKYGIFTDNGATVTMTRNREVYEEMSNLLVSLCV